MRIQAARSILLISLALAASRCSTTSERATGFGLRAPSALAMSSSRDKAARIANSYIRAKVADKEGRRAEACDGFIATADDAGLPSEVRALARIRAYAPCGEARIATLDNLPAWLDEEATRAKLARAREKNDPVPLARAIAAVVPFEKVGATKVERLKEAIALAGTGPSADAALVDSLKRQLVNRAPRFALEFGNEGTVDAAAIAKDLRDSRNFDQARTVYRQIASDKTRPTLERLKALDGFRMTYKLQLRTDDFLKASDEWALYAQKSVLKPGLLRRDQTFLRTYFETRILYARAIWTDHRPSDARKILLETEKQLKGAYPVHESQLIRARIEEEAGRFDGMAEIMNQINIDALPDRSTKARFLWFKGWNLKRLGKSAEAAQALEQATNFEEGQGSIARNQYWTARILKGVAEKDPAKPDPVSKERSVALFKQIIETNPFSLYGILAHYELGLTFSPLPNEDPENEMKYEHLLNPVTVPTDWFIALDELEIGKKYLESLSKAEVWSSKFKLEKKIEMLSLYSRLHLHQLVNLRIDELDPDDRKTVITKRPDFLFPMPYRDRVMAEASRQKMEPGLIYAIMRQESLFNPLARSPADAFGLMQLIPEMAASAARSLGTPFKAPEELYDPDKNIAFGAVFLKELFRKYDERFILAVAAYNANDRAIQGWLQSRLREDPLEFVEDIPYEETRLYVKLVLRNLVCYQRRFSATPISFPTWTLRLKKSE